MMFTRILALPLAALLTLSAGFVVAGEPQSIGLEQLEVQHSTCGWEVTQRNKSVAKNPLRLRGKTYERGIGTHSPAMLRVDLGRRGLVFHATVGVDDEVGGGGTVEFRVVGDGKVLWSSGVLTGGGEVKTCDVKIEGVKTLDLVVDTTPDGSGNDHADWVDTRLTYAGAAPVAKKAVAAVSNTRWPSPEQVFEKASLPDPSDRDDADAVLRRTEALVQHLTTEFPRLDLGAQKKRLAELKVQAGRIDMADSDARAALLEQAAQLRRKVAFANPLLDFDKILFIKRHFCPDAEMTGNHMCDQYFGFNAIRGGGLFVLEKPFSDKPTVRNVLENAVCTNGRFKDKQITGEGGFLAPELSFDARQILFAWTEVAANEGDRKRYREWTQDNTYKIFRVNVDGSGLTQLTDGTWNDFDPCFLPNGRVLFISERRGGYGRCHGRPVPSFTLHSMEADGSDIVCLSPHETNEWQPSVNNDGNVLYTRWDYVDRGFNQAHHAWTTTPDGRDPRVVNGNFSPNQGSRPHMEISIRAVPNSRKLMATAACHHGQAYGSIILIDPGVPDDEAMGPVKRLTPDQLFPEAEIGTHGDPANYAAPWPLSEHFFLCVYDPDSRSNAGTRNNYGIYLVDAFGNKELLYRDPEISCLDPIPLKARPVPPVIPTQIAVAKPAAERKPAASSEAPVPDFGLVSLMNVNDSLYQMPPDKKITHLRIIQLLPKTTPIANSPRIGFGDQKSARLVLGTVPVEEDGSAFFKMPAGKPVYFQALAADGMALQSMRSATYVHPGENLTCRGCHEPRMQTIGISPGPRLAFKRPPSEITPEVEGSRPFSYPILVQPVLDKNCVACHEKSRGEGKNPPNLARGESVRPGQFFASYNALRGYTFFWDNAVFDSVPRTTPGKFGARASRLYQIVTGNHHGLKLAPEDLHRLALWLDCNSDFYGSYENLQEQLEAKVIWPKLQ